MRASRLPSCIKAAHSAGCDAIPFAFEAKPKYLYKINQNKLPMGCHAWYRYNLEFWRPFIEGFGYKFNFQT